jgi:hypothetical protein
VYLAVSVSEPADSDPAAIAMVAEPETREVAADV